MNATRLSLPLRGSDSAAITRYRLAPQILSHCGMGRRPDFLVQAQAAVGTLAEMLDLPKRDASNWLKPGALCPSHDGPIPECSETRRAARATDEAKQLRAKEEHKQQARHSQHHNENAAGWFKQVNRGADADGIGNAREPVPSLVFRISEVFPQRHERRFYDQLAARAIGEAEALPRLSPEILSHGGHRIIKAHGAERTIFDLRTEQTEGSRHRNGLAESGSAFRAADEQERDDGTHKAEYADEGKVAGPRPAKAHVRR